MELNEYVKLFRRRLLMILFIAFLGVDAALLVTWLSPKTYEAHSTVFIRADSPNSSSYEDSQFTLQRVRNYPDLVNSPQVLQPVVDVLGGDYSVEALGREVSAENPADTVYVQVTGRSNTPEMAVRLTNLVTQNLAEQIRVLEAGGDRSVAIDPRITVPAIAPSSPTSPNPVVNLALGLIGGLTVGMLVAVAGAGRDRRIFTARDVRDVTGLEVVANVRAVTGRPQSKNVAHAPADVGSYRELLTHVLLANEGALPKVLLATAACPGADGGSARLMEGWAAFLARTGRRVCLVEADRQQQPAFGMKPTTRGLLEALGAGEPLSSVVVPVRENSLYVLPAGTAHVHPADLMRRVGPALGELSADFDVVLIHSRFDSRPLSNEVLSSVAQGALILACYGRTTDDQLDLAALELRALKVRPLGVVLLSIPRNRRKTVPTRALAEGETAVDAKTGEPTVGVAGGGKG
ncbi:hypothetical protein MUK71_05160 [Arthrobacter zhangbolii]|uniref:Polysaccharide chain length determinant N-terminal domain-containing protein n=1 Tax=Arthrobacter zhangbolii TaxID=2886936 RepID=A0A9X1S9Y0_9MICC|nr:MULTISPECIES: Wzz/FepE/Etk N-terminal domain-containing protein [Arthrobacter]MCC3272966.1 hypothetical protein [Arthrobacter zhangbolii]MDN3905260.1 hypothetical protein [Arthrobacter sp. YD2]UON93015.1 hypothetical protein MUK71_05160 [Arthrobacter zhangbolii]